MINFQFPLNECQGENGGSPIQQITIAVLNRFLRGIDRLLPRR